MSVNPIGPLSLAIEPLGTRPGARFALKYALIAGVLFAIYAFPFDLFGAKQDWLAGYLAGYARLAGGVLGWFEPGIVVERTSMADFRWRLCATATRSRSTSCS